MTRYQETIRVLLKKKKHKLTKRNKKLLHIGKSGNKKQAKSCYFFVTKISCFKKITTTIFLLSSNERLLAIAVKFFVVFF